MYWFCRLDRSQAEFQIRSRCHRHHDLGQNYRLYRLHLNLTIQWNLLGIRRHRLNDHHHRYRYRSHQELHHHQDPQVYWFCRLDRSLAAFHVRLRCHRRLDRDQHYHLFRLSLNQTTRLHHVGRHPLHLSDRHHQYRYRSHQELHHHQDPQVYWFCRLDRSLAAFHVRLRCHRHHDLNRHYHPCRPSLNLPIQCYQKETHQPR